MATGVIIKKVVLNTWQQEQQQKQSIESIRGLNGKKKKKKMYSKVYFNYPEVGKPINFRFT